MKIPLFTLMAALAVGTGLRANEPFPWPAGARCAVSLTYDDTLDSQLDHAVADLQAHGMKATFFLITSSLKNPQKSARWAAAIRVPAKRAAVSAGTLAR